MSAVQPVFRFDLERDVRTAHEMAARLVPYIYESELYGQMPGDLPRLTLGGLLMRLHRLSALPDLLTPAQQEALKTGQEQLEQVRKEWPVAYEGKLKQELKARLSSLGQFLSECAESPQHCLDNYPSSIEKRVIAEVLRDEAAARNVLPDELAAAVTNVDNKLRRYVNKGGDFIWDKRLQPAYPRDKYWYLYTTPGV
jgi:hypothetical protein